MADCAICVVQPVMRIAWRFRVNRGNVRAGTLLDRIAYRDEAGEADLEEREYEREDSQSPRHAPSAHSDPHCVEPHLKRAARRYRATPSGTAPA
jgi:hypothetical protein